MAVRVIRKFRLLYDVTFGTPNDGDVATYDQATDKVIMAAPTGGGGGAPSGPAGGVLSGTYPDPGFAADMATQAELNAEVTARDAAIAAAIASLVDSSPGTLDTLNELAAALGDDPNFATTVTNAVAAVQTNLNDHLSDATDAHDASAISVADAANDFTATDVEGALAELQSDAEADAQNLADHVADSSAAHAASAVSVSSATLSGTGTDVQASLEELDNGIADHLADTSAAHAASAISFSPTGTIAATDVQAAIAEVASEAGGGSTDGWTAAGETWTYASADSPTFAFTVAADVTTKYSVGMRIKLTQTTDKYFIVTKVSTFSGGNTTITVYGGTDYTLANASITSPYWSMLKAPFGFPLDPAKWTVTFTDSSRRNAASLTNATWFNPGSLSFDLPIGVWDLNWWAMAYIADSTGVGLSMQLTLSTANNSESDTTLTGYAYHNAVQELSHTVSRRKTLALTAKTTYYVNLWGVWTGGTPSALAYLNDFKPLRVSAVCAYL